MSWVRGDSLSKSLSKREKELEKIKKAIEDSTLVLDEKTRRALFRALAMGKPVLLQGPPGTGKTEITRIIAEALSAKYVFYQCTPGVTEDELIYKYTPSESTKSGVKILEGPLPEALKMSQEGKVVLVLDEFDKTRPTADSLLLDYLQNFRITMRYDGEKEIIGKPENLIVFITSNDEREFSEPLLRRLAVVRFEFLTPEDLKKVFKSREVSEKYWQKLIDVYTRTISAGLEKPATIPELLDLAKAMELEEQWGNDPLKDEELFEELLREFIIKSDSDWEKFISYEGGYQEKRGPSKLEEKIQQGPSLKDMGALPMPENPRYILELNEFTFSDLLMEGFNYDPETRRFTDKLYLAEDELGRKYVVSEEPLEVSDLFGFSYGLIGRVLLRGEGHLIARIPKEQFQGLRNAPGIVTYMDDKMTRIVTETTDAVLYWDNDTLVVEVVFNNDRDNLRGLLEAIAPRSFWEQYFEGDGK